MAENRVAYARLLSQVPLFARLQPAELNSLAEVVVLRRYDPGELVFGEGEPCEGLYVVQSGHIRVFKTSASGREQVLTIDGPGSSVAEIPVFDGEAYPASGAAVDTAALLFIGKNQFQTICLTYPRVALEVLRVVGGRLRRLVGIIEELSFTTVRQRLVSLLCRLARNEGRPTPVGIECLLPAGHQEIAAQIGTVRELVSRNLSRLQAEGLLSLDGRTVVIRDLKALESQLDSAA